jgi:hypothetical protein
LASIGAIGGSIGNAMRPMMASSALMRDLGRRALVGLAAMVAIVAAVGYGLIATNIASPLAADLGTVAVPEEPGAQAVLLTDGRPAFVVHSTDATYVLDARVPLDDGVPGRLVGWCGEGTAGAFIDVLGGGSFGPDGTLLGGPGTSGLPRYPTTPAADGRTVTVGREPRAAGTASAGEVALDCPPGARWLTHAPAPAEVFDPSVAADEEPPGWIWLEGRLEAVDGQAVLCDDVAHSGCATGAVVRGIDPAKIGAQPVPLAGIFIGQVGDGAIDELYFVPVKT